MRRILVVGFLSALTILTLAGVDSCTTVKPLITDVVFKLNPNLETLKVQLNFGQHVQSDLGGTFEVNAGGRSYGVLEVDPSTSATPFNVGFALNLDIVNEQEFVNLTPVEDLPTGQRLPSVIGRKMVQVKMVNQVNPNFDIYAYIDVPREGPNKTIVGGEWLGLAMTLKFMGNKYFPAGLSIIQNFLKDPTGNPRASGAVFGPKVDGNGELEVPGGIALFANVKALIESLRKKPIAPDANGVVTLNASALGGREFATIPLVYDGPGAGYYEKNPDQAYKLSVAFTELMRANCAKK